MNDISAFHNILINDLLPIYRIFLPEFEIRLRLEDAPAKRSIAGYIAAERRCARLQISSIPRLEDAPLDEA